MNTPPRVLIFGTMWVDSIHREELVKRWIALNRRLNPECDLLLVDGGGSPWWAEHPINDVIPFAEVFYFTFPENIGHASKSGRDGWGRSFCTGLLYAIDASYDYVVHIESDSLFRLPVMPIVAQMQREGIDAASAPVEGTRHKEHNWVETGLMFFRTAYVRESDLIRRYDWQTPKVYPAATSESVLFALMGDHLRMMPWRTYRNDKRDVTRENVASRNIDWLTHCWHDLGIYDAWAAAI